MENFSDKAEDLVGSIKEYISTSIELGKLKAAEKASFMISNFAAAIAVAVIGIFFALFTGIALALLIGHWIGSAWVGFAIIGAFFLIIALVIWFGREKLIQLPVMNNLIHQFFKHDEED